MSLLYRKIIKRLGLLGQYKTEKIGDFLVTYEPETDIGGRLYRGELFEKAEINIAAKYIKKDSIVLDIGANIGLHALSFSAIVTEGLVIAFEPQPKTFGILQKNIIQNSIKNIIPLNLAVAQNAEIADFFVMDDDAYSSLIDTGRKVLSEKINVVCTTIDGLLGRIKVDFIKIDVEGLELDVLNSMVNLIKQCHPVIFCEIYKGKISTYDPNETIAYLKNMEYKAYRVVNGRLSEFADGLEHEDRYYNYFFVPLSYSI